MSVIVRTLGVRCGEPRIANTRITVEDVASRFAAGETLAEIADGLALKEHDVHEAMRVLAAAAIGRRGLRHDVRQALWRMTR